ncbi:MAG: hypothetical protein J7501_04710 [Bdellovibrio sp.]|nr:hypothetical protein [Bdellovibrio sp.]
MKSVFALVFLASVFAFAQDNTVVTVAPMAQVAPTPTPAATSEADANATPVTTVATDEKTILEKAFPKFSLKSYGYFTFSQEETFKAVNDLTKYNRRKIDLAEIAFEGIYDLTTTSKIEFEVEIEHGGVGTSMEYDPFEEFGEFEKELEQGGEVALTEFVYKKNFNKTNTALKVGKFPLFISLGTILTKPSKYAAINASDVEIAMIPYHWNEMGVQVEQKLGDFTGRLGLVSGLNSEFFRSYNWVGGGYQRQFETINADDLATVASIEWGSISKGTGIGLAYYNGNTTNNRYKKDKLTVDSYVTLVSLMVNYKLGRFMITGEAINGTLENSDKVSTANKSIRGLNPGAFSALGHKAELQSLQLAYEFSDEWIGYLRHEHVNTFEEVQGSVVAAPRYDRTRETGGLMWAFEKNAFMKFQYAEDQTDLDGLPKTKWFGVAFGFDIGKFN